MQGDITPGSFLDDLVSPHMIGMTMGGDNQSYICNGNAKAFYQLSRQIKVGNIPRVYKDGVFRAIDKVVSVQIASFDKKQVLHYFYGCHLVSPSQFEISAIQTLKQGLCQSREKMFDVYTIIRMKQENGGEISEREKKTDILFESALGKSFWADGGPFPKVLIFLLVFSIALLTLFYLAMPNYLKISSSLSPLGSLTR